MEQQMSELIKKAWAVINSCETHKQARGALRYLDLLAEAHPDVDVSPLRHELITLFEFK
jgi:hypothetical protein